MVISNYYQKNEEAIGNLYVKLESLAKEQETKQIEFAARIINKSLQVAQENIVSAASKAGDKLTLEIEKQHSNIILSYKSQLQETRSHRNITMLCAVFSGVMLMAILIHTFLIK